MAEHNRKLNESILKTLETINKKREIDELIGEEMKSRRKLIELGTDMEAWKESHPEVFKS